MKTAKKASTTTTTATEFKKELKRLKRLKRLEKQVKAKARLEEIDFEAEDHQADLGVADGDREGDDQNFSDQEPGADKNGLSAEDQADESEELPFIPLPKATTVPKSLPKKRKTPSLTGRRVALDPGTHAFELKQSIDVIAEQSDDDVANVASLRIRPDFSKMQDKPNPRNGPAAVKQITMDVLASRCSSSARRDALRHPFAKPFNGAGEKFDDFLDRFDQHATLLQWTEMDRIAFFGTCLSFPALRVYNRLLESGTILSMSLVELEDKMRKSFPTATVSEHQALNMLTSIHQDTAKSESIPQYAIRFEQTATRANMMDHGSLIKTWCGSVKESLRQPLGIYTASKEGKNATWEEMVEYTVNLENSMCGLLPFDEEERPTEQGSNKRKARYDQLEYGDEEEDADSMRPSKGRSSKVRRIETEDQPGVPEQLKEIIIRHINRVLGVEAANQFLNGRPVDNIPEVRQFAPAGQPQYAQDPRQLMSQLPPAQVIMPPGPGVAPDFRQSCYLCGEKGHLRAQCPMRQHDTSQHHGAWQGDRGGYRGRGCHRRYSGRGNYYHGNGRGRGYGDGPSNRYNEPPVSGANATPPAARPDPTRDMLSSMYQNTVTTAPVVVRSVAAAASTSTSSPNAAAGPASGQGN